MTKSHARRWSFAATGWRSVGAPAGRFGVRPGGDSLHAAHDGAVNTGLAALAIAALLFIPMAGFLPVLATISVAVFLSASLGLLILRFSQVGPALLRFWPLLILPAYAVLSTAWSDAPPLTMRAALELMVTFIAAMTIATLIRAATMIYLTLAIFVVIGLVNLPFAAISVLHHEAAQGLYASKNQLGYCGSVLLMFSAAIFLGRGQAFSIRVVTCFVIIFGIGLIYVAKSAGATIGTSGGMLVLLLLRFTRSLPSRARSLVFVSGFAFAMTSLLFTRQIIDLMSEVRNSAGKDRTLSGRTELWDLATRVGAQSPWVGHGFGAFWRVGNLDAEAMWRRFGIAGKSGFNFHNTYVESYVDLGLVGLALLAIILAVILARMIYREIAAPTWESGLFFALFVSLIFRHFAESGLVSAFSANTIFLVAVAVYAFNTETNPRIVDDKRFGMQSWRFQFGRWHANQAVVTRRSRQPSRF